MQLELGRRADYAIRATVDLARHYDDAVRRKAREIAEEMNIPRTYVPQILAELVRAGFAASVAGPSGGYVLARPPEEISLLAVVRAADREPVSRECVLRGGPCRWEDICAVHVPWFEAQQALIQRLDETNFREVVEIDQQLDAGTYRPPAMPHRRNAGPWRRGAPDPTMLAPFHAAGHRGVDGTGAEEVWTSATASHCAGASSYMA